MSFQPKSVIERLVTATVALVAVTIGLTWVWHRLRPLLPVLVTVAVVVVVWKLIQYRRNSW